jgi:hypothetical protein
VNRDGKYLGSGDDGNSKRMVVSYSREQCIWRKETLIREVCSTLEDFFLEKRAVYDAARDKEKNDETVKKA